MTTPTQSEKRIAIAKAIGWIPARRWQFFYDLDRQHGTVNMRSSEEATEFRKHNIEDWVRCGGDASTVSEIEEYDEWENCPSYFDSLEACHEAENALSEDQHGLFRAHLWELTHPDVVDLGTPNMARAYASAPSDFRAEAIWLTICKTP